VRASASEPAGGDLLDLLTGYQVPAVVTAAQRVGLFDAFDGLPTSAETIAERIATAVKPTRALLDSLVAIGLVQRMPDGYAPSPQAVADLGRHGALARVVEKEAVFARLWLDLDQVLRSGEPLLAPWRERLDTDPQRARAFLDALDVLAERTGPALHLLPELAPDRHVVDVGGGLGAYARQLARVGCTVTLVELPAVAAWAQHSLAERAPRVAVVAADAVAVPACGVAPASHDAAIVSHVVHDLAEPDAVALLANAAQAVRPGGHVVVNEFAGDSGPGAFGPLFDVMMQVETGGCAYPEAALGEMMVSAGLRRIRRAPFADPATVLVGSVERSISSNATTTSAEALR
jgi:SAM-dependent methyltransferase